MARPNTLRQVLVRIDQAVRDLASANGWGPDDYRLSASFREGAIVPSLHLLLEGRSFPGADEFEQWDRVLDFLERKLKDVPELRGVMHLVIEPLGREHGEGYRSILDSYTPIEELIAAPPVLYI